MEAMVDRDRCEGTGFCVRLAPDHFALDEHGTAVYQAPEEVDGDLLEEAEALCPTNAVRVRDGDD